MKEYRIVQPKKFETFECEMPEVGQDEVLVRVTNIGLCGSDLQLYEGTYKGPYNYPLLFGHEWSGVVQDVGANVTPFRKGDKVTGDCSRFCGECAFCEQDKNLCKHIEKFGITIDGASSEFISRDQKYIYHAPDDIDLALLSLSEPLAVSAHLIRKIERTMGSLKDKNILVLGAGTIGLGALMMLKYGYGAEHVDVFDICEERMSLAGKVGAGLPPSDFMKVKGGGVAYGDLYNAKYDVVIESTGNAQAFCSSLSLAKPLGVIGCVGMIPEAAIEQKLIVLKGLHIIGSIGGTGEFPRAIEFIKSHSDVVERIVSHKIPIDQAEEAFAIARNLEVSLKVVLELES